MRNARFWEFHNGAPVKITLRPGQTLHTYQGGPTDEGWSSERTSWRLSTNGRMLERQCHSDGADCDGRLSSSAVDVAEPWAADFVPMYYTPELMRPDWREAESWQRDQYAEAAGY